MGRGSWTETKLGMTLDEIAQEEGYGAEQTPRPTRPKPYPGPAQEPTRRERDEGNVCYVVANADVNRTAGYVAHGVRNSSTFLIVPAAWESFWSALKVIAVARSYLQTENLDFCFELVDSEDLDQRLPIDIALELSIDTDGWVAAAAKRHCSESPVSAHSEPSKVAGRLANIVRADADCCVSVSGPDAAAQAIESLRYARSYLYEEGRDISFAAEFGRSGQLSTIVYISVFKTFKRCKVNPQSDPHLIAGYIAQGIREGRPPCVSAIGIANLNVALKAVAVARSFLEEEDLDIACRVDFPDYGYNHESQKMKMSLATISGGSVRQMTTSKTSVPLYVSANTKVDKVAGALAQRVRMNQKAFLAAMGPAPVAISLKCVYLANRFLLTDSVRIRMSPEFAESEQGRSLLCLHVLPELWV